MEGPFKSLLVWQKAMSVVKAVYRLAKSFPVDERYALTDQLRRAVVSIPSNIAEGNGRSSNADYAHFLAIARGSLYETMTQLQIAVDLGYVDPSDESYAALSADIGEVGRMLTAMLKKFGTLHRTPTPTPYTSPTPTPTPYTSPTPTPTPYTSPTPLLHLHLRPTPKPMTANRRIFLNIVATYPDRAIGDIGRAQPVRRSSFALVCGLFTARCALKERNSI